MDKEIILKKTEEFVRSKTEGEGTGHDWWHMWRVRNMALRIAEKEGGDILVVQLAALLHDIADWKFHGGDEHASARAAKEFMESAGTDPGTIAHVCDIINKVSFKGASVASAMTPEGMAVQDADRLDAIGAIGIARAFAYGGLRQRELHNPDTKPVMAANFDEYNKSKTTTINHFHEKLLLLKDMMNTETGRQMAEERHAFLEKFLEQFMKEWNGKDEE